MNQLRSDLTSLTEAVRIRSQRGLDQRRRPGVTEQRNRDQVTRRRWWYVGAGLCVPLAFALSQPLAAHATAGVASAFTPITPVRALDSRSAGQTAFHFSPSNETDVWTVANANGIPVGATAIVLNITIVSPSNATYVSVWPA